MIEVTNLTKDYGPHRAIDHLNFNVSQGEVVGFLGPNGAGKSTTMRILTGYISPTEGTAKIGGYDVFENPIAVKRQIGYLPENPPVYLDMSVSDYLRYVAKLKKVPTKSLRAHVDEALKKVDLLTVRDRLIQNLSKGFRQRVGIAQALVSAPELLILDEPTVGLDPKQVAEVRQLIQSLRGKHTIILSTHILPEVEAVCERIIIINKGKIVAQNTLSEISPLKEGARRVSMRVARDSDVLQSALESLSGVRAVSRGTAAGEWAIDVAPGDGVLEDISKTVVQGDYGLLRFEIQKANLEDVFIKLTYDQNSQEKSV